MAESKRVQLETARPLQREKRSKGVLPTLRFDLALNETTDSACPEFSYGELVKATRTDNKDNKSQSDDLFGDDDDDDKLQEIARKFEEKYNPKPGKKKKKKPGMWEDYVDKGMGYDETDPFIDNEEAYDELVPSTLTTQYGGFYVNTGELEFKNASDVENGIDDKMRRKRRKRDMTEKDCKKRRRLPKDDLLPKKRGRKITNPLVSALPKMKKKHQPTVADMLQQRKANLQLQKQEKLQEMSPIPVERHIEPEVIHNEAMQISPEHSTFPVIIGPNSTISEAIESVVKASGEEASSNGSVGLQTGSSDGEEVAPKPPMGNIEAPKLPDKLPLDLETYIDKLKEAAYNSEEGKCKFFTDEINRMLLSVELKSQELSGAQRSTIYSHLASHLPCTKETLQKRAKKLRLDQEDGKLREPMQKLSNAIVEAMPELLVKYAALVLATGVSDRDEVAESVDIMNSDDEESEEGKEKTSQISRRKFEWNDTIRKYLCDVVRIKLKCFEVSKTRVQSAEEYLKHFLEVEVKRLWPDGWMNSRILFKESSVAHAYITNKPKKPLAITKKPILNSLPAVTITMRPAMSILNTTALPQELDLAEPMLDKYVPSPLITPCIEEIAERKDVLDTVTVPVNCDDKPSDLSKLFTFPIKTKSDALSPKLMDEVLSTATIDSPKARTDALFKNVVSEKSDLLSLKNNSTILGTTAYKASDKIIGPSQPSQSKHSILTSAKVPDFSSSFNETSLASDMLARIICASLGDFPYAGSPNADSSISKSHMISPGSGVLNMKENRVMSSKLPAGVPTSPLKYEGGKQSKSDIKKPSQEISSHGLVGNAGIIGVDALILSARASDSNATSVLVKHKVSSESVINPVNLKLKDVVPQPRQFAEAFERYNADIQPSIRKHSSKGHSLHMQNISVSSASPTVRFSSANELPKESGSNIRTVIDSTQRVSYELSKYNTPTTSQGVVSAPYKKRGKFSQSSKTVSEQWSPYIDVGAAASLLEGMKGFPFPVTLPTPPPAHCSAPHKTAVSQPQDGSFTNMFTQHSPQRTNVHTTSLLRVHQDSRSELSNHNKQVHTSLSKPDVSRRQSLIQGTWKAVPTCQTASASHNQYLSPSTSPISNPKSTSPNNHSSNSHQISSPIHSHSHSVTQSEKVPPAYSHSSLPLRVSPSHTQTSVHSPKSSPSNIYSQPLNQAPFPAHQSSHSVTSHQLANARNSTTLNTPHSSSTVVNTPAVPFVNSQEQQVVHPRTNL